MLKITYSVKKLSATAIFKKNELALRFHATAITLHNIRMLEQLVHTNLLLGRLVSLGVLLDVDLLHGAGLARVPVHQELHLGERAFAEDLEKVPAFDEFAHHAFKSSSENKSSFYIIIAQGEYYTERVATTTKKPQGHLTSSGKHYTFCSH